MRRSMKWRKMTKPAFWISRSFMVINVHCVSKNIPDIFDCNLKTNYQLLIIFGTNIPAIKRPFTFPSHPMYASALPREIRSREISLFYPMQYDCLIKVTRKNTFCSHFWHFGWHFIQLSIFQLPAVKLIEVLAHCVNTGKETLSPFIDSTYR